MRWTSWQRQIFIWNQLLCRIFIGWISCRARLVTNFFFFLWMNPFWSLFIGFHRFTLSIINFYIERNTILLFIFIHLVPISDVIKIIGKKTNQMNFMNQVAVINHQQSYEKRCRRCMYYGIMWEFLSNSLVETKKISFSRDVFYFRHSSRLSS